MLKPLLSNRPGPQTGCERRYLCTQLEINHDDADLGAGDHQNDEDQEEEAKQVIELVLPDGLRSNTHDGR